MVTRVMASVYVCIAASASAIAISIWAMTIVLGGVEIHVTTCDADSCTLSRDAVYQGSATLAGLAIFGSLFSTRILKNGFESKKRGMQLGSLLFVSCPYTLAIFHIYFMFLYDPNALVGIVIMVIVSFFMIVGTVTGYYFLIRDRRANIEK